MSHIEIRWHIQLLVSFVTNWRKAKIGEIICEQPEIPSEHTVITSSFLDLRVRTTLIQVVDRDTIQHNYQLLKLAGSEPVERERYKWEKGTQTIEREAINLENGTDFGNRRFAFPFNRIIHVNIRWVP
jgi:hypothetical protein